MKRPVRVEELTVEPLSVPTVDPFVIATGQVQATRSVLVRVTLSDEAGRRQQGLGEGACLPPVTREDQPDALAAVQRAAPKLVGQTFNDLAQLVTALKLQLESTPVARAGIEMAVLDGWARLDGVPLWRWLGGGGVPPALVTDMTLPILPPARMVELARQWRALGFTAFKVKVGKSIDADLNVLEQLVKAIPGVTWRPDANGGLSVEEALTYAKAAARLGARLECFEQPCRTTEELAEVAAKLEVPVLADESVKTLEEFFALKDAKAADGVNLKIAKSGGLMDAFFIGAAARAHGMSRMVGGMVETRLGMTAAAHLAAALGGVEFCDLDTAWLLAEDPFVGGYLAQGPRYTLPDSPGLGVALKG
ncbi:MAG: Mandelate racemase/muconate lactonizing protein [Myxococcaceae bacterium]|nr:Mandelate racemase/muconate lactonizing protein [Myxococcaceae bacterium]